MPKMSCVYSPCGNQSWRYSGRTIKFDPEKEVATGDEEANRLINQPMRAPWHAGRLIIEELSEGGWPAGFFESVRIDRKDFCREAPVYREKTL